MTTNATFAFAGTAVVPPTAVVPVPVASERQRTFLASLIAERTANGEQTFAEELAVGGITPDDFVDSLTTRAMVSDTISRFLDLPKLKGSGAVPEGFHFVGGNVYKVQSNRAGTSTYAKILVVGEPGEKAHFDYIGRTAFTLLSRETLLTAEQAAEFGKLYGVCCVCGALLTDEASIERGIGPVCAEKF